MNQHERPDGDGNTKPLELAGKANAFLTKRVAEVAEADPDLEDLVLNVLSLASEEEFRKKIPVIAVELCRIGAWAYPGGRKHRKKGKKQGLGKRRMKRFLPDVQPYDLIDHAWNRVLADIQEHREMSEFRTISSVQLFITRFTRNMEDHLKALAQREASHAGVTDKKSINEASTIIDVDQYHKFGARKLMRKLLFFTFKSNKIYDFWYGVFNLAVCHTGNFERKGDIFVHSALRQKLKILKHYTNFAAQ